PSVQPRVLAAAARRPQSGPRRVQGRRPRGAQPAAGGSEAADDQGRRRRVTIESGGSRRPTVWQIGQVGRAGRVRQVTKDRGPPDPPGLPDPRDPPVLLSKAVMDETTQLSEPAEEPQPQIPAEPL